jgi:aryl-alcohol dehydrogenase-like predicted oxidoreductase
LLGNPKTFDVLDKLNEIAKRNSVALNQLAILWMMAKSYITTPILGGTKPEHFRTIYDIADKNISEADVKEIDRISGEFIYRQFQNQPVKEGPALAEQW